MKAKLEQLKKETEKLLKEMGADTIESPFRGRQDFRLNGEFNNFECSIGIQYGIFTIFGRFDKKPFDKWINSKFNFHKIKLSFGDIKTYLSIVDDLLNLGNPPYINKNNI